MLFLLLALIPSLNNSLADYSDISGSFEGKCLEHRFDGITNQYEIRFDILQANPNQVHITTTMNEFSVEEAYDITKGLTLRSGSEGEIKIYTGGTFGTEDDSFATTLIFVSEEGNVDTVLTEYRKDKSGTLHIIQTSPGNRMICALPQIQN